MVFQGEIVEKNTKDFIITDKSPGRISAFPDKSPIDMIADVPPIVVDASAVWCDGGNEFVGHPRVYIRLENAGPHPCGYCGLRFERKDHTHGHSH